MKQRFASLQFMKLQTTNLAMHSDKTKKLFCLLFCSLVGFNPLCAADFSFLYNINDPASLLSAILTLSWYYISSSTFKQMCVEKPSSTTKPRVLPSLHSISFILCSQVFPETMNMKQ